jgi:hypothetical protein
MARHRAQQTTAVQAAPTQTQQRRTYDAPAEARTHIEDLEPTQQDIANLAYHLWEQAGCRDGCAEEDWYRAERMLKERTESRPASVRL